MKLGYLKIFIFLFTLFFANVLSALAADKITSVPLANLEELSPTFEEDKDELEKIEDQDTNLYNKKKFLKKKKLKKVIKFMSI